MFFFALMLMFGYLFFKKQDEIVMQLEVAAPAGCVYVGPLVFCAVMDGHGGSGAAIFTRDHLLQFILEALSGGLDAPAALTKAFKRCDDEFIKQGNSSARALSLFSFSLTRLSISCVFVLMR